MAFGISGSRAQSRSSSRSTQEIFGANFFQRLFGDATNVAGGIDTAGLSEAAERLFDSGTGFLGDLQNLSGETESGDFLSGLISGGSGLVDENISALGEDLGQFFTEELLPGITNEAVSGLALGGGRQGVAQGKAVESISREFRRGSLDIRNADLQRRTDAATAVSTNKVSAAGAGLLGAQQQFDLANAGLLAPFSPFLTLSQILGEPTTLTETRSSSSGSSASLAVGGSAQ
jgi:hypothetical protein